MIVHINGNPIDVDTVLTSERIIAECTYSHYRDSELPAIVEVKSKLFYCRQLPDFSVYAAPLPAIRKLAAAVVPFEAKWIFFEEGRLVATIEDPINNYITPRITLEEDTPKEWDRTGVSVAGINQIRRDLYRLRKEIEE